MNILKLKTGSPYEEKYSYSRLIEADGVIVMANTAGRNYKTREMPATALGQAQQAMANIEGTLTAADASLADVVRIRVAVPNADDVPDVMTYLGERFRGVDPVLTVTCTPLAGEYLVEIEVTALRGAGQASETRRLVAL